MVKGTRELTDADDVELESALEQLALNLGCDAVETDMALGVDGGSGHGRHCVGCCWVIWPHGVPVPKKQSRVARCEVVG